MSELRPRTGQEYQAPPVTREERVKMLARRRQTYEKVYQALGLPVDPPDDVENMDDEAIGLMSKFYHSESMRLIAQHRLNDGTGPPRGAR